MMLGDMICDAFSPDMAGDAMADAGIEDASLADAGYEDIGGGFDDFGFGSNAVRNCVSDRLQRLQRRMVGAA